MWLRAVAAFAVLGISVAANDARAVTDPLPLPTDRRLRTVVYNPNEVYAFVGHYGFQSAIEFQKDEVIQTISVGDSTAWQIEPSGYRIFLKPIAQDATTNMTVITDKRTYMFELYGRETEEIRDPSMVFWLRFVYSDTRSLTAQGGLDSVPMPEFEEPGKYHFDYTITGPEDIAPIRIFDDGEFTYFEFRDKNAEVPAFFLVDSEGREAIINYRTRGNYIVVERVAPRFTLRNGSDVVCVYNERMPLKRMVDIKSEQAKRGPGAALPPPPPEPSVTPTSTPAVVEPVTVTPEPPITPVPPPSVERGL